MPQRLNYTLLIVDDSQEDRAVIIDHIEHGRGDVTYRVLEAEDLHAALVLCEQVAIDCILLDYRLPDGSGLDFLRHLPGEPGRVGVVFMTGQSSEETAVSAMRQGAVDYVNKANMNSEIIVRALAHACRAVDASRKLALAEHARAIARTEQMRSEGDLQRLIESIRDYGIITLDISGRVARWGAGARNLLRYHDHEAVGRRFDCMLRGSANSRVDLRQELNEARQKTVNCQGRWLVRRDGSLFWGTSVLTPMEDECGEICGFALVIQDISAWRDITQCFRSNDSEKNGLDQDFLDGLSEVFRQLQDGLDIISQEGADCTPDARARIITALSSQVRQLQTMTKQCTVGEERELTSQRY